MVQVTDRSLRQYLVSPRTLDLVGTSELSRLGDGVHAQSSEGIAKVLGNVGDELFSVLGDRSAIVLDITDSDTEALECNE